MLGLALGQNKQGQNGNSQGQNGNSQGQNAAPEINPSQAISALALLSGGLLVLRRKD